MTAAKMELIRERERGLNEAICLLESRINAGYDVNGVLRGFRAELILYRDQVIYLPKEAGDE